MFSKETYVNRRKQLKNKINSGLVLILGNNDSPMNYKSNTYHFRQDSTFLYFFGIDLQGLAAIIDIDNNEDILFGDDYTIDDTIWMGPQTSMQEKAALSGINRTEPFAKLSTTVSEAISKKRLVHFTPPYRGENIMLLADLLNIHHREVEKQSSLELTKACIDLRSIKEPCEIEEMERQMTTAYKMHTTAMKMARPGIPEQEITGVLEGVSMSGGGMISFPVICSVRGETLHNHYHGNMLKKGDLLLVDAGSESQLHYATDHTRTTPVTGKFSETQRKVYQIVLEANDRAREATKPGVAYRDVHLLACKVITSGLKEMGLMKGNIDEAVAAGAHALFMPHGLGHMIGLDVHDMEDYDDTLVGYDEEVERSTQFGLAALRLGRRLQPGFTITNEPGVYFIPALIDNWKAANKFTEFINYEKLEEFKGFGGIRLEDDLLVTEEGCRILGKRIPITVEEVEQIAGTGV
ncbi:aminopeptidase P family protein [Marinilabilia sp.]|uniref:aminopeptidase P family protein n=1 Tax=Marinilabilia sp. TaxID=2021252 RepID=UPI0025B9E235|nr:aminopeptidase P family protein [Marinilabilia sp.]